MTDAPFPLPGGGSVAVAAPAPGAGPLRWAGASSAAIDDDGSFVVAYRVRVTPDQYAATIVGRSIDGANLETVATLDRSRFGAMSMERPALVRLDDGRWRLYVCAATPGTKHWWIDALDADDPAGFADAEAAHRVPRRRCDGRQGPGRPAHGELVGGVDLLPSARRAGRGGSDDDRLRDERRRVGLALARHRAGTATGTLGRPRARG